MMEFLRPEANQLGKLPKIGLDKRKISPDMHNLLI
jgi:hypothetical protein